MKYTVNINFLLDSRTSPIATTTGEAIGGVHKCEGEKIGPFGVEEVVSTVSSLIAMIRYDMEVLARCIQSGSGDGPDRVC